MAQPGRWFVEIFPWLRFVPTWMPGAGFKRRAAWVRERMRNIDRFPFNWTKEQIVRHMLYLPSHPDLYLISYRNPEITLSHSHRWAFSLKVENRLVQKTKTSSSGVALLCTRPDLIL